MIIIYKIAIVKKVREIKTNRIFAAKIFLHSNDVELK